MPTLAAGLHLYPTVASDRSPALVPLEFRGKERKLPFADRPNLPLATSRTLSVVIQPARANDLARGA